MWCDIHSVWYTICAWHDIFLWCVVYIYEMTRASMMPYIQHVICMYIVYMICIITVCVYIYVLYGLYDKYNIWYMYSIVLMYVRGFGHITFALWCVPSFYRGCSLDKKKILKAEKAHEKTLQESSKKWWVPLSSLTVIIYIPPQTYILF